MPQTKTPVKRQREDPPNNVVTPFHAYPGIEGGGGERVATVLWHEEMRVPLLLGNPAEIVGHDQSHHPE